MTAINKFDPRYSISQRGFNRRGAAAAVTNATATTLTMSGLWSDAADFAVLTLFDADDVFGALYSSKYLPDFDLTGIVLDFDLAIVNCMYPGSLKFPSIPWNKLSYILKDGTSGTAPLTLSTLVGEVKTSATWTVLGTPFAFDRILVAYLGNVVFDYIVPNPVGATTPTTIATALAGQVNTANGLDPVGVPITATSSGPDLTITCTQPGEDGNVIEIQTMFKTGSPDPVNLSPPLQKLTGGVNPTSFHVSFSFTPGFDQMRQCWLTLAPNLPWDSTQPLNPPDPSMDTPSLVAFTARNFNYVLSNITLTDPNSLLPLKVADPDKSVVVDSRDVWAEFGAGWVQESGFYHHGWAHAASTVGRMVKITYSCQYTHDLYLGTSLYTDRGIFGVELDGVAQADLDCYLDTASQLNTRRVLATGVAAGTHTVLLTTKAGTGNVLYYDYLQAAIPADPVDAAITYAGVSAAADFDTDQTYKIAPARLLYIYQKLGLLGDLDFYAGVFFALIRRRKGGNFLSATVTVAGPFDPGTGFGDGSAFFVTISGQTIGAAFYPEDDADTLAQRLVDGINGVFVGVHAQKTIALGEFTVTVASPINGFALSSSTDTGFTGSCTFTGTIGVTSDGVIVGGQEGIWEVDDTQTSPLNRAFSDYLADFSAVMSAAGFTFVVAFSQELLAPPDQNTSAGAWIQRYNDGTPVLTATGFGSWGKGYVEAVSGAGPYTVTQTGHGYITGYFVHFNGGAANFVTVIDADHYSVPNQPFVADSVVADLQTSQCCFNPSTVTPYLQACHVQSVGIMAAAGIAIPWDQEGEIFWWFFAGGSPVSMAYYDAYTIAAALIALGRPLALFTGPNDDPSVNSFDDANFLISLLQAHIHTIHDAVLAATPSAKFELLWAYDVNWLTEYTSPMGIPPIGGQLNRYVNLPPDYTAPGSDVDRFKIEALAWGTTYRNMNNAIATILFYTTDTSWPLADVAYLVPWQNGGCPWTNEYLQALNYAMPNINMWALDHIVLFSWELPFRPQLSAAQ